MATVATIDVLLQKLVGCDKCQSSLKTNARVALTTVGGTSDDCGKRFNDNVTMGGDRLTGAASTWARAKRRAVRRNEKCMVAGEKSAGVLLE